jgi:hypothetical protein
MELLPKVNIGDAGNAFCPENWNPVFAAAAGLLPNMFCGAPKGD